MVFKILNLAECINKFDALDKVDVTPVVIDSTVQVQRTAKELAPNKE